MLPGDSTVGRRRRLHAFWPRAFGMAGSDISTLCSWLSVCCVHAQSITEEWKTMKKRKGTARLITIDGYQVLKENNYSLEQVCLPHALHAA